MMNASTCYAVAILALGLASMPAATSIVVSPDSQGFLEARPTLVHSDATASPGGRVLGPTDSAYGVDHGGVALIQNGAGSAVCSGALLSSGQHILTAAHCATSGLNAVFDAGGTSITVPVVGVDIHPNYGGSVLFGYDVAVLTLDTAAPNDIPRYDVNRTLNDLGVTGVAVGFGGSGYGENGATVARGDKRAGLIEFEINALPSILIRNGETQLTSDFDSGSPSNDAMALYYGMEEDLGFGADEVGFASGDSGGPVFMDSGSGWVIAGVASYEARFNPPSGAIAHSDIDGTKNSSWGEFSVAARVGEASVVSFIDNITGLEATPVPEPSTGLLALLGLSMMVGHRRR